MKSCLIKNKSNGRVFAKSVLWENFPHENFLDECQDVGQMGMLQSLQADFLIEEEINLEILKNYDIVIYSSNNDELPNYHVDYVMPCEPGDRLVTTDSIDFKTINLYHLDNLPKNHIFLPFSYDLKTFRKFSEITKTNKIMRSRRSEEIEVDNYEIITEGKIMPTHLASWEHKRTDWMKKLAQCKYCYSTCSSYSPGQIIAEASMLDIITFSTGQKVNAKILLPEFCIIKNANEINDKIKILDSDTFFKDSLLKQIRNSVDKYLNLDYLRTIINSELINQLD
jgi:hypothetical protein